VAVQAEPRRRLPPEIFELPVEKLREGWYTDAYFNHTRATLLADGRYPRVVMQIFQKRDAYLGGMDEAIAILKLAADWDALSVGSSLIRGANDCTADIVLTDGRESAKVVRSFRPNPRLERVE
jgi:hypothetical protein